VVSVDKRLDICYIFSARAVSIGRRQSMLNVVDLEVIVPAFNEEARIGLTLTALAEELSNTDLTFRLRVIDNGSTDRTSEIVDQVRSGSAGDRISIEGCSRQGKGAAVTSGMMTSSSRWVGYCDADLATAPSAIDSAVCFLRDGWPIVIGSRYVLGAHRGVEQPIARRVGGAGFRFVTKRLIHNLDLADTQCGFKFFARASAQAIFSKVRSVGFAFDVEVVAWARELGYPVKELPVDWVDRPGSSFRSVHHGAEVAKELWRLRRSMPTRPTLARR
jgi:glycosyltransferase involved in cell wall biosynthesis